MCKIILGIPLVVVLDFDLSLEFNSIKVLKYVSINLKVLSVPPPEK